MNRNIAPIRLFSKRYRELVQWPNTTNVLQIFVMLDCGTKGKVSATDLHAHLSKMDSELTHGDVNEVLAALQSDKPEVDFDDFLYKIAQIGAANRTHNHHFKSIARLSGCVYFL